MSNSQRKRIVRGRSEVIAPNYSAFLQTSIESSALNNQNHEISQYRQLLKQIQTVELEPQQAMLFATCLIQRMLPNYRVFSENTGFGEFSILNNIVDLFWQKASGLPVKINVENQLVKLMAQSPDKSEFDIFAVNPAIDLCTGVECILVSLDDKQINIVEEISLLSRSSVASYLEYVNNLDSTGSADAISDEANNGLGDGLNDSADEPLMSEPESLLNPDFLTGQDPLIISDPLFQWEVETQLELLNCISEARPDKKLGQQLKQDISAQKLSNLGIEY